MDGYYELVGKMLAAVSERGIQMMEEAVGGMKVVKKEKGNPHTQSLLGFLVRIGHMREMTRRRSFCIVILGLTKGICSRRWRSLTPTPVRYDKAVKLYVVLVEVVVNSFLISEDSLVIEPGEPRSIELLGEIYARALKWLMLASRHQLYSAYNGMWYLYVKGYGIKKKNCTKAKEYFEKEADNKVPEGHHNLGVMYRK